MIHAVAHLYHFQQFLGACSALGQWDVGVEHGQFDVFERRGARNQVKGLEHEADFAVADDGELVVLGLIHAQAVKQIGAFGRAVKRADDVHQGTFA